ncbi:ABC transporter permease [Plantactinospora soyae]|uniref:ABC-2 type transport system permease protein n=1 Tax=Plantactinospora soyae TaxID=1544732 RepID=A0A927M792_9ACTN|nr:ABC transporter permease [Plantactinospora soyae]MBE1488180.1 ABC-2 type transport system permease protein [Plantactinospora soyae]
MSSIVSPTPARTTRHPHSGGGLPGTIASEWTKLWSVRSVWWSLLASVLLMAATAGQLAIYVENGNTNDEPGDEQGVVAVGRIAIDAVELTQFAVIALALLVITAEYSTGTIRPTLQWTPSRWRLLLAKTSVVAGVTFCLGVLLGGLGAAVAAPVLGQWGRFDAARTLGDVVGLGAYLALISVFTLGLGAALRGAVGTLVTVFLVLVIVPTTLRLPDLAALNSIADALPGSAGLHFLRADPDPYPPAVGLLLLLGWALAALLAGHTVLRRRDA